MKAIMRTDIPRTSLLLTTLCAMLATHPLAAQLSATVPVGATVRWSEDGRTRQGVVRRIDDQAELLWVDRRGVAEPVQVTLGTPELAMRTRPNRKAVTALVGLGAGFALGMATGDDKCSGRTGGCAVLLKASEKAMILGGTFGLLGFVIGPRAKWQLLADPIAKPATRVAAIIEPGRLGVRVAF